MSELNARHESFISMLLEVSGRARPSDLHSVSPSDAPGLLQSFKSAHPEMQLGFDGDTLVYRPDAQQVAVAAPVAAAVAEPVAAPVAVPQAAPAVVPHAVPAVEPAQSTPPAPTVQAPVPAPVVTPAAPQAPAAPPEPMVPAPEPIAHAAAPAPAPYGQAGPVEAPPYEIPDLGAPSSVQPEQHIWDFTTPGQPEAPLAATPSAPAVGEDGEALPGWVFQQDAAAQTDLTGFSAPEPAEIPEFGDFEELPDYGPAQPPTAPIPWWKWLLSALLPLLGFYWFFERRQVDPVGAKRLLVFTIAATVVMLVLVPAFIFLFGAALLAIVAA